MHVARERKRVFLLVITLGICGNMEIIVMPPILVVFRGRIRRITMAMIKHRLWDRIDQIHSDYTTCTEMSGSGVWTFTMRDFTGHKQRVGETLSITTKVKNVSCVAALGSMSGGAVALLIVFATLPMLE